MIAPGSQSIFETNEEQSVTACGWPSLSKTTGGKTAGATGPEHTNCENS
jgi:hypothetical protein